MGRPVIECDGITKVLGKRRVVDGVSLTVAEGEVFGFLGRNGAGKTTTIRMLLGLARITAGRASILETEVPADRTVLERVGALIEEPALYPWMSGWRNLRVLGPSRAAREDFRTALKEVDLLEDADRKVKTYSQGMRQRLALALAICSRPRLVILDEPSNGLDPAGIRAFRETLRKLTDHGATVFLSSHQLGEVERTCDRAAILHAGKIIATGTIAELGGDASYVRVELNPVDHDQAVDALSSFDLEVATRGELKVRGAAGPAIGRRLASAGIYAESISPGGSALEERFLSLTGEVDERRTGEA